jgi:DNA helicase HerA-like ATPase
LAEPGIPLELDAQTERFRELRTQIEKTVLPLATSVDGGHFTCQLSPHDLALRIGGYAALEDGSSVRIGQLVDLQLELVDGPEVGTAAPGGDARLAATVTLRVVRGTGVVRSGTAEPFHDAVVRPATSEEVASWLDEARPPRARLEVGELRLASGVPAHLDAGGFDRHTFLCGQSGSGKTYSLGVILERLLLETSLRIVILDPNSDFVRLGEARQGIDGSLAERHGDVAQGVVVRSAAESGSERLALRFADLDARSQAAALRLDPVADREEYAELVSIVESLPDSDREAALRELLAGGGTETKALGLRLRNLGVEGWQLWARQDGRSIVDEVTARDARCLVVDLGSLATLDEKAIAAEAVLGTLWRRRDDRAPTLVVVDEAHNVCPSEPRDPVTAIAAEHAARIAAEGRKYGLYLLVSTQRPQKVDEQVLSQCDNLVLMRMNSRSDLALVSEAFSFVPPQLLGLATDFGLGEALVAGKIASHPALVRFGARVTEEGGSDVAADWARPLHPV